MTTPIYDFLQKYAQTSPLRLHMPGHKGTPRLGIEHLDLTEVKGADSLYEADGIIKESEANASTLFGCPTYYSTEGSSQCIRAMLYLAMMCQPRHDKNRPLVLAGRNAHKTFLTAISLLDMDVTWLYGTDSSYLSCYITPCDVEIAIQNAPHPPVALYLTSPDYLGHTADIDGIAEVCHRYNVLLLVDNAHGAYLKFLGFSTLQHPMDLGADICCDSAHKTLPVLTGGAYLHIAPHLDIDAMTVKGAMALFGSSSPSYLILSSLDLANKYICDGYQQRLSNFLLLIESLKNTLVEHGFDLVSQEPLKITISTKSYGYTGHEVASYLEEHHIVCEFADPDFVVFMLTPDISEVDMANLQNVLLSLPKKAAIITSPPQPCKAPYAMSPREALLSPKETVSITQAYRRILAMPTVACPPAVPIVVSGEMIDKAAIDCFLYYGITTCVVVKG